MDDAADIWKWDNIVIPIHAHMHSGVYLSVTPFSDPWDSAIIGYAVTSEAEFLKKCCGENAKVLTLCRYSQARAILSAEIAIFNAYLDGDVWGYIIVDDEGNETDSCWGYYGRGEVENAVTQLVEAEGYEREKG